MPIDGLSQQQRVALIAETNSAKNLLAYGVRVIRTGELVESTRDPIFTMLSIGLEKLQKLALGLIDLDRDGRWPLQAVMIKRSHGVSAMHEELLPQLESRSASKPHPLGLLAVVKADPVVAPVIVALDTYGRGGRFHYVDRLGDATKVWDDPRSSWHDIEQAARIDPQVSSASVAATAAGSDNTLWATSRALLGERIATAVERLWISIAVCGRHGVLGEAGKPFGFEVHPTR